MHVLDVWGTGGVGGAWWRRRRSPQQFPNCDGSHMAHNKETGDNVGPVIVKKD